MSWITDRNAAPGQIDLGAVCESDGTPNGQIFVSLRSLVTDTRVTLTLTPSDALALADAIAQVVAVVNTPKGEA